MLVITRKPNEEFTIGQGREIRITILDMKGNKVRIGIEAPRELPILRDDAEQATPRTAAA